MSGNSAAFIGSIPKDYDQGLGPVIFADYARVMAQRAVAGPVSRVLETACGTGILTRALLDALPSSANLMATDLNADMLKSRRPRSDRERRWSSEQQMVRPCRFPTRHSM